MEYIDPWTGAISFIFPTGDPDKYPLGYFGDTLLARLGYRNPDEQIEYHQFWANSYQLAASRMTPFEKELTLRNAEAQVAKIEELQNPAFRSEIAQQLLMHRAAYIETLTFRDRTYIERDNELLRSMVIRTANPEIGQYEQIIQMQLWT